MAYEKRLCVLKQIKKGFSADGSPLSGAVYAERMGNELTVTPRLAGIAPVKEGRYALAVWAGGREYCLALTGGALKIADAPSLKDGFAVLLCFVRGEAEPVAFGCCGSAPANYRDLLKIFSEEEKKRKRAAPIPVPMPPTQVPGAPSPQVPLAPAIPVPDAEDAAPFRKAAGYDDEAIASDDYFRGKLFEGAENDDARAGGKESQKAATGGGGARADDENGAVHPFRVGSGSLTYYNEMREKLEDAFSKYPKDDRLQTIFPRSDWVNTGGGLLGVIYENGRPRYICAAAESAGDPPAEMKGLGIFVPRTHFSDGEGFYVVFQDADTGETVKTYES